MRGVYAHDRESHLDVVKEERVLGLAVAAAVLVTEVRHLLLCNPVEYGLSKQGQEVLDRGQQILCALTGCIQSLQRRCQALVRYY